MNILISYDFLTTNKVLGQSLCEKLDFIASILVNIGMNVNLDNGTSIPFSQQKLYGLLNKQIDDQIFESFDDEQMNEEALAYIKEYTDLYDLLIMYEMSSQTKALFDKHHIKYIDIWMSPIRFHKDIMFSFFSNDHNIQKKLIKYKIDEEELFNAANNISDHCNYFNKDVIKLEKNCVLIVGQLLQDKSVMRGNQFLTLVDFKKEITTLSQQYQKVYFIRHPLMNNADFDLILTEFMDLAAFEYLENVNVYSLMAKDEIDEVVAISSSVLYEAKYFNKKYTYLYQPVMNTDYINIYKDFYKSQFWANILDKQGITLDIEHLNYDNYLRYKFNTFYAYEKFMGDDRNNTYNEMIKIYNLLNSLSEHKNYILYGFGSVGKLIYPFLRNKLKAIIDKNLIDKNIDHFEGIKVINIEDIKKDDYVIISAFLHNNKIKQDLKKTGCYILSF